MEYMFLLSVLAGVLAFGAFILICWAYILLIQLKIDRAGWKILIGVLSVVLLAVPCSVIAFFTHAFFDVNSEILDWAKAISSWVAVPPLFYYLLYCIARRFPFFRAYPSGYWLKLACSGTLIAWALLTLIVHELATTS